MKTDVLLGLQWGDEGKGKIVDVLTPNYNIIARFQGGPNAGHTLIFEGVKHVLHTIPSGIFRKGVSNVVGNGVVIDPVILAGEIDKLIASGVDVRDKLLISRKAHLILPTHRLLDAASEADKGKTKIGSTLKGIGPTYMDKTGRNGLRVGDIEDPQFMDKYRALVSKHQRILDMFAGEFQPSKENEEIWLESIEKLKKLKLIDAEYYLNNKLDNGEKILAEGAQGTMLDIDFGSYPFVTSSTTTTSGTCTGLGIPPNKIGRVIGIFKAYCTRVGSGPFPTELQDEIGATIQKNGGEFGATTGRPRRCGWLDLPALKYSIMINGVTELAMTKADVLSGFDTVQVCVAYDIGGKIVEHLPFDICRTEIKPQYKTMPGWKSDLTGIKEIGEIPMELSNYISYLESELNVPITIISVGPDRNQTLHKERELC